jgi:hypothetical protein
MAVATSEEFFAILQKSKLLTPSQLAQARELAREGDDPTAIAKALARRDLITRWQAGQLLAGRSSFYLGKYRLIELLGRGGMGSVFLGQHVTMNRRVALKIISRQVRKDRASLDRFLAEARAIATLDHPNIVQVYSVDNEGDRYYMVMEYVEGLDLERLVEEDGPLECRQAAEYVRQAAEGLDHAHQRNMIHCDIKPSNLLVNVQGVVKILDMGLARLMAVGKGDRSNLCEAPSGPFRQIGPVPFSDPEAGSGGGVLGSVDYLAPEQAIEGPGGHLLAGLHVLLPADRPSAVSPGDAGRADPQAPDARAVAHSGRAAGRARRTGRHLRQDDGQAAGGPLSVGGRSGARAGRVAFRGAHAEAGRSAGPRAAAGRVARRGPPPDQDKWRGAPPGAGQER